MNEMKPISNFRNNLYRVAIILLLAYAAFSTAMKDLDRLQELAGNVQSATTNGLGGLAEGLFRHQIFGRMALKWPRHRKPTPGPSLPA